MSPSPLPDPVVEAYWSGAWHDISADVTDDGIEITHASNGDPSEMRLGLKNQAGLYSPRNPNSSLYGLIGRNTPIRCSVALGAVRVPQPSVGDYFSAPDSAALSITGDIDIRADIDMLSWRPTTSWYAGVLKQGSYGMWVDPTGHLVFYWSVDGSAVSTLTSTESIPGPWVGRKAIRVTFDVNVGGTDCQARFWTSDSVAGTWAEIGNAVNLQLHQRFTDEDDGADAGVPHPGPQRDRGDRRRRPRLRGPGQRHHVVR
jgi:hypothetical protein